MDSTKRKALPIGVDNFYDLRSNDYYYVDKTFLIQRLLDTETRSICFTRPHRFGKSLALSMLRCFFDCNAKEKNLPLFEGLAVAQSDRYMKEQSKYPVIYIDFKTVKGDTRTDLEVSLQKTCSKPCLHWNTSCIATNCSLPR